MSVHDHSTPPRPRGPPPPAPSDGREPLVVIHPGRQISGSPIRDVSWETHDLLSDAVGEAQHVYLAYDGKDLEIMTKGRGHEGSGDLVPLRDLHHVRASDPLS